MVPAPPPRHETQRSPAVQLECLGQSGFRFQLGLVSAFIDPYLSDRVAAAHGEDFRRMVPPPYTPEDAPPADWILLTHAHDDHCDPDTLRTLCARSPAAKVLCPGEVARSLLKLDIAPARIVVAEQIWTQLGEETRVHAVPAAHTEPERDADGRHRFVGYVIEYRGRRIYHAGDTSPHETVFEALKRLAPIDVALLPVNERNYYRARRGIVGNMSVREAFQMAADLDVQTLVPIHWDLFAPNSVFREELFLLYDRLRPPFHMVLGPTEL